MTDIQVARPRTFSVDVSKALIDYVDSVSRYELWMALAWFEIKVQYKRSVLGPFWITLSTGIAIATIGPIYAKLMGAKIDNYFSYLATSIILWNFIAGVINTTDIALIGAEGLVKDAKLPFIMFIIKEVFKNIIYLAHTSLILVILMFFFTFDVNLPLFILCFSIVVANLFWIGLFLSIVCTRFRDVAQIVTSLVQVAFFVTPVMWQPHMIGDRHFVVALNPFYYLIDVLRNPLLDGRVDLRNLGVCVIAAIVGNAGAFFLFTIARRRIAYWL
jgi:ABC-type polysaccharide/polyol phosphate export permease